MQPRASVHLQSWYLGGGLGRLRVGWGLRFRGATLLASDCDVSDPRFALVPLAEPPSKSSRSWRLAGELTFCLFTRQLKAPAKSECLPSGSSELHWLSFYIGSQGGRGEALH